MNKDTGFTLIELIITIVLLGIVAGLGVNLIYSVFMGYSDTKLKNLLYYEAKFTIERMDRELRMAIPNSIRISNNGKILQFAEFKDAGYYNNAIGDNISYYDVDSNKIAIGDNISIYNVKPEYFFTNERNYEISNLNNNQNNGIIKLNKKIERNSPYNRFFIIDTPVTFYYESGTIKRCFGYPIVFNDYGNGQGICNILTTNVENVSFVFQSGSTKRSAIVKINLKLKKDNIELSYSQEVHVRNVP